ncbi:V-type ATP synthase subunit D [Kitasatospora sp. NPDC001159]
MRAEAACRETVRAAAALTAARKAARLMAAETERTARRVPTLRRRWIPRLSAELAAVGQALEQAEHEEAVRRRWAAGQDRQGGGH